MELELLRFVSGRFCSQPGSGKLASEGGREIPVTQLEWHVNASVMFSIQFLKKQK